MKRVLGLLALSVLLIAATPEPFGGWDTVTLLEVPEYLEVGTPTTLSFKIRQHGQKVVWDREPTLILGDAGLLSRVFKQNRVRAQKGEAWGVYEATITPETPGELAITIDTDLFGVRADLRPFRVVAQGSGNVVLSDAERGRQLFMAKGCASCHAKLDDDPYARFRYADFGPPLVGRAFPVDYLTMKIKNPAELRSASARGLVMPKLELDVSEIEALVRFFNGSAVVEGG